jgi:hypothetical protein
MKPRVRWANGRWQSVAEVKNLNTYKSPEQIAEEVSRTIIENGLTEVVMIGECPGKDGLARCYKWMLDRTLLWYAEQLRFKAIHGYFPE